MSRRSHELVLALVAVIGVTLSYLLVQVIFRQTPRASSLYGHSMGILGFLMMVMTETLYTMRKRSRNARLGKMAEWLEFHIFTGIVGPYMVFIHSAWKFNGLAGVLILLTLLIVLSGFVGRYIYTAVPRTPAGVELSLEELQGQAERLEKELASLQSEAPDRQPEAAAAVAASGPALVFGRAWWDLQANLRGWASRRKMPAPARLKARQLASIRQQRDQLQRQIQSLAMVRHMLAIWHAVHIPIGLTLFIMAFIHVLAAVYFALLTN